MTARRTPNNGDADLIRYIDGELAGDERARLEAEIAADPALADRFATLNRRSSRLHTLLSNVAPTDAETAAADPSRNSTQTAEPEPSAPENADADKDDDTHIVGPDDSAGTADGGAGSADAQSRAATAAPGASKPIPGRGAGPVSPTQRANGRLEATDAYPLIMPMESTHRKRRGGRHAPRRVDANASSPAGSRWLKAAIVIIAVSLGAVLVPPVRAWIVQKLQSPAPPTSDAPSAVTPPGPQVDAGVLDLQFDVGPSRSFEIDLAHEQARGELRIRSANAQRASATRTGGVDAEEMLVSSRGLRIRNTTTSSASYEVVLPAHVRSVAISVGTDAPPIVVELNGAGSSRTVSIARKSGS